MIRHYAYETLSGGAAWTSNDGSTALAATLHAFPSARERDAWVDDGAADPQQRRGAFARRDPPHGHRIGRSELHDHRADGSIDLVTYRRALRGGWEEPRLPGFFRLASTANYGHHHITGRRG